MRFYCEYSTEELERLAPFDDYAASELNTREAEEAEDRMYYDELEAAMTKKTMALRELLKTEVKPEQKKPEIKRIVAQRNGATFRRISATFA